MMRVPNWELRLHAFARAEVGRAFEWGETNCVALGLRAIDVQLGTALHAKYRKHMATERRAMAWAKRYGVDGIVSRLVDDGLVVVPANFEREGDILLTAMPDNIGTAVVLGRCRLSSTAEHGVELFASCALKHDIALGVR